MIYYSGQIAGLSCHIYGGEGRQGGGEMGEDKGYGREGEKEG